MNTASLVSRRHFLAAAGIAAGAAVALAARGPRPALAAGAAATKGAAQGQPARPEKLVCVWEPNKSSTDADEGRKEFADVISKAVGVPVEVMSTTDYVMAVEAIAAGTAHIASLGSESYVQAHAKNPGVQAVLTTSGKDGSLDTAKYYSRTVVPADQLDEYRAGDGFTVDPVKGKRISFVSTSSSSGFKVPASYFVKHFGLGSTDELTRPGFFSEVLFGTTHPGCLVNLLEGDADVACMGQEDINPYLTLPPVEGEDNVPGAVYEVRPDAQEPCDRVAGQRFGLILAIPVLNAPVVVNTDVLPQDMVDALVKGLTDPELTKDEKLFAPKGADTNTGALYRLDTTAGFVQVDDAWYDPIRQLDAPEDGAASSRAEAASSKRDA